MARGNRGIALSHYARSLYDGGHTAFMLVRSHETLMSALAGDALYENPQCREAQAAFMEEARKIESRMDVSTLRERIAGTEFKLGRSVRERQYRTWCLESRLFINPLNDVGTQPIAAQDVLTLPSITVGVANHELVPAVIGLFNQMKQEFVSARYLYYEGIQPTRSHFSDRDVLLYNTLDYPAYSLGTEKIRTAFRMVYSLFDKISFFLNHYLQLGHAPNRVTFRRVWYEAKGLRSLLGVFAACPNWPLRGLFWLSKDLFEDEFQSVTEPDAESLNEMRNHLEHKYLQIHQEMVGIEGHSLKFSIHRQGFEAKTLRVLKLARAALMYLSLAVWSEERRRHGSSDDKHVVSMPLSIWRDEWKR